MESQEIRRSMTQSFAELDDGSLGAGEITIAVEFWDHLTRCRDDELDKF